MHCTSDSEINGGIIILFPFCSANFPISSPSITHPSLIISIAGKKLGFTIEDLEDFIICLLDKSRRWLQRRHSRKLPHMAIGFFSKWVSNCLSHGEYLLSWEDVPRTQNTRWITSKVLNNNSSKLIILFVPFAFAFAFGCNRINIVLIGFMSPFAEQCTLPGGAGEITQKAPGGWVGLPSGTPFPCLIKSSYSIQQAIMETLMKWVWLSLGKLYN